jgi:hypothetical protein
MLSFNAAHRVRTDDQGENNAPSIIQDSQGHLPVARAAVLVPPMAADDHM